MLLIRLPRESRFYTRMRPRLIRERGLPTMSSSVSTSPSPAAAPAIELLSVSKLYGSFVALRGLTLSLPPGSSVVLLGPNGAGKSTLLKLLAGLAQPSYGQVRVFGQSPSALRGRIAYMGHSTMLYDELTGGENLAYFLGLQHPELTAAQRKEQVTDALRNVALDPANTRRLGEYSQGMRQRASLARVLLSDPDLLLLDEPFSNLDTASVAAMITRLQSFLTHSAAGRQPPTLLLTTHQAELARPLAQHTLTLGDARLVSFEPTVQRPTPAISGATSA